MVQQQRYAVFTLCVGLAALVFFLALLPRIGWMRAQGAFSILAVWGAAPFLFRRRSIVYDERLRLIHLRALQIAGAILWLLFVSGMMCIYYHYRGEGPVNVEIFPLIVYIGCAALLCVPSIMLLILHRLM